MTQGDSLHCNGQSHREVSTVLTCSATNSDGLLQPFASPSVVRKATTCVLTRMVGCHVPQVSGIRHLHRAKHRSCRSVNCTSGCHDAVNQTKRFWVQCRQDLRPTENGTSRKDAVHVPPVEIKPVEFPNHPGLQEISKKNPKMRCKQTATGSPALR